jgi:protein TonB
MRILRTVVMAAACVGAVLVAHGQAGGVVGENTAPVEVSKPRVIRISTGVLQGQLLTKVSPVYPADARDKGIQGQVTLHIVVGKDGNIQSLDIVSGPEELRRAALTAVKQWKYKPYLLNGEPVDVDSLVLVNFNLAH